MKRRVYFFGILAAALLAVCSCNFVSSLIDEENDEPNISLSFDSTELNLSVGEMDKLNLVASEGQNALDIQWTYDGDYIQALNDNYGIIITALKSGTSIISATYGNASATCKVNISGQYVPEVTNPYVYASSDFINVVPGGDTVSVYASAYGVSKSSDLNSFSWTIDKPSVASIVTDNNYCWVTGKSEGLALLTVSNSNVSGKGFSILVNCSASSTTTPYLTTLSNQVNMNLSNKAEYTFNVTLNNPINAATTKTFNYTLYDTNNNPISSSDTFSIDMVNDTFNITAKKPGVAYLRITHEDAPYPLDIILHAEYNADLVYILPSETQLFLSSVNKIGKIEFALENLPDGVEDNPNDWSFTFSDGYTDYLDCEISGGSNYNTGNVLTFTAKENGIVKITAENEKCPTKKRSVLVVVRNMNNSASSATTYITTSQNYVTLKKGSQADINVYIMNSDVNKQQGLIWNVEQNSKEEAGKQVISWDYVDGKVKETFGSRSGITVSSSYNAQGKLTVTGQSIGRANISIEHPDCIYKAEIIVNVVDDIVVEDQNTCYLTTSESSLKLLARTSEKQYVEKEVTETVNTYDDDGNIVVDEDGNAVTTEYTYTTYVEGDPIYTTNKAYLKVDLVGSDSSDSTISKITWSCDDSNVILSECSGETGIVYIADGVTTANSTVIKVSHPDANNIVNIPFYYYFNAEDADKFVSISVKQNYYVLYTNLETAEATLSCSIDGEYYGSVDWSISEGASSVEITPQSSKYQCLVKGINPGVSKIKATADGVGEVEYTIKVIEGGKEDPSLPIYFTTENNVVYFESVNETKEISVNLINALYEVQNKTTFEITSGSENYSIDNYNGLTVAVTSLVQDAEGILTISNPLSQNQLNINLRTGQEFIYINPKAYYISSDTSKIDMYLTDEEQTFSVELINTQDSEVIKSGFTYEIEDPSIASLEVYGSGNNNTCGVKPLKQGSTIITISHPNSDYSIDIPLIVSSTYSFENTPYITTTNNVVTVVEGEFYPVTVSLQNGTSYDSSDWYWQSENSRIADVTSTSGNTILISGNSPGTTKITVSHTACIYPLSIVVNCVSEDVVKSNPYISVSENIVNLAINESATITAEMVGGSERDALYFSYSPSNSSVAMVNGVNDQLNVRGVAAGSCYVTIRNTNYSSSTTYSKTVLVNVYDTAESGVYITSSSSVISLKPTDTTGTNITATLNGGDETDNKDFVWWIDDTSLATIQSMTNTCSVVPKGKTGSTYIHVRHKKAAKTLDFVLLVSDYTEFDFSSSIMNIITEQMYIVPMEVPSTSEETEVVYKTDNQDICLVYGTDRVCMLMGLKKGEAAIKAQLVSKVTKKVISEAEMLVSVTLKNHTQAAITINNSVYNLKLGDDTFIEGFLSGENIAENDVHNLEWSVLYTDDQDKNGLELLSAVNGTVTGNGVYITANVAGTYVLQCKYKDEAVQQVLIYVAEAKEKILTLDQAIIECYGEDGGFDITASISNAEDSDYAEIEWTATKYNGANIVRISTSGQTCNVIPIGTPTGRTVIKASLPDGTHAECVVIFKEYAYLEFTQSSIARVYPGDTVEVPFKVFPEGAEVEWYDLPSTTGSFGSSVSASSYKYSVDYTKNVLKIKATSYFSNDTPAGEIKGVIKNFKTKKTATLSVYCEDNAQLVFTNPLTSDFFNLGCYTSELRDDDIPENWHTYTIEYYPSYLTIVETFSINGKNVTNPDEYIKLKNQNSEDFKKDNCTWKRVTYSYMPQREFTNLQLNVAGYLSESDVSSGVESIAAGTITIGAAYDDYTVKIEPEIINTGNFSKAVKKSNGDLDYLELGDGEEMLLKFTLGEKLANVGEVLGDITWNNTDPTNLDLSNSSGNSNGKIVFTKEATSASEDMIIYRLKHKTDYRRVAWYVEKEFWEDFYSSLKGDEANDVLTSNHKLFDWQLNHFGGERKLNTQTNTIEYENRGVFTSTSGSNFLFKRYLVNHTRVIFGFENPWSTGIFTWHSANNFQYDCFAAELKQTDKNYSNYNKQKDIFKYSESLTNISKPTFSSPTEANIENYVIDEILPEVKDKIKTKFSSGTFCFTDEVNLNNNFDSDLSNFTIAGVYVESSSPLRVPSTMFDDFYLTYNLGSPEDNKKIYSQLAADVAPDSTMSLSDTKNTLIIKIDYNAIYKVHVEEGHNPSGTIDPNTSGTITIEVPFSYTLNNMPKPYIFINESHTCDYYTYNLDNRIDTIPNGKNSDGSPNYIILNDGITQTTTPDTSAKEIGNSNKNRIYITKNYKYLKKQDSKPQAINVKIMKRWCAKDTSPNGYFPYIYGNNVTHLMESAPSGWSLNNSAWCSNSSESSFITANVDSE